jgi:hypothetical protein
MVDIYHQLGWRYQWNLDSIVSDGTADGIIVSPRYMHQKTVVGLPLDLRKRSIFDPQFYVPNSARRFVIMNFERRCED